MWETRTVRRAVRERAPDNGTVGLAFGGGHPFVDATWMAREYPSPRACVPRSSACPEIMMKEDDAQK
jgi:hypothetical protein